MICSLVFVTWAAHTLYMGRVSDSCQHALITFVSFNCFVGVCTGVTPITVSCSANGAGYRGCGIASQHCTDPTQPQPGGVSQMCFHCWYVVHTGPLNKEHKNSFASLPCVQLLLNFGQDASMYFPRSPELFMCLCVLGS